MIGEDEKENVNDQGYVLFLRFIERKTNENMLKDFSLLDILLRNSMNQCLTKCIFDLLTSKMTRSSKKQRRNKGSVQSDFVSLLLIIFIRFIRNDADGSELCRCLEHLDKRHCSEMCSFFLFDQWRVDSDHICKTLLSFFYDIRQN